MCVYDRRGVSLNRRRDRGNVSRDGAIRFVRVGALLTITVVCPIRGVGHVTVPGRRERSVKISLAMISSIILRMPETLLRRPRSILK